MLLWLSTWLCSLLCTESISHETIEREGPRRRARRARQEAAQARQVVTGAGLAHGGLREGPMACGLARGGDWRTHGLGAGQRSVATAIATSAEWKVEWNPKPMNHVSVSPCFREVFR